MWWRKLPNGWLLQYIFPVEKEQNNLIKVISFYVLWIHCLATATCLPGLVPRRPCGSYTPLSVSFLIVIRHTVNLLYVGNTAQKIGFFFFFWGGGGWQFWFIQVWHKSKAILLQDQYILRDLHITVTNLWRWRWRAKGFTLKIEMKRFTLCIYILSHRLWREEIFSVVNWIATQLFIVLILYL